jgi:hypothetical protein
MARFKIHWPVCAERRFNLAVVSRLPHPLANDEEENAGCEEPIY